MFKSLNPCFSGSCSWSREFQDKVDWGNICLNPCFSGSCSWSLFSDKNIAMQIVVLILVLVEVALGVSLYQKLSEDFIRVLILVLVEVALGVLWL